MLGNGGPFRKDYFFGQFGVVAKESPINEASVPKVWVFDFIHGLFEEHLAEFEAVIRAEQEELDAAGK